MIQTHAMAIPGLVRHPSRVVLDLLGELMAVPVYLDGLVLENSRLRRAFTSYKWIVEKASAGAGAGAGAVGGSMSLPELPEAFALMGELQEVEFILKGNAFQICLGNVAQSLAGEGGNAFRDLELQ